MKHYYTCPLPPKPGDLLWHDNIPGDVVATTLRGELVVTSTNHEAIIATAQLESFPHGKASIQVPDFPRCREFKLGRRTVQVWRGLYTRDRLIDVRQDRPNGYRTDSNFRVVRVRGLRVGPWVLLTLS